MLQNIYLKGGRQSLKGLVATCSDLQRLNQENSETNPKSGRKEKKNILYYWYLISQHTNLRNTGPKIESKEVKERVVKQFTRNPPNNYEHAILTPSNA